MLSGGACSASLRSHNNTLTKHERAALAAKHALTHQTRHANDAARLMEELAVLVAGWLDAPPATHARTKAGPPPIAKGSSVTDDPDAIWAADHLDAARIEEADAVVAAQGDVLAPFWVKKYDREASKAWDRFYRRTSVAPYKDRHYLDAAFPGAFDAQSGVALEVGCGCGSAAAPILRDHHGWRVVAIDFAASAVERLRARLLERVEVCCVDVVADALPCDAVDVVLCLFVLSSIAPGDLPGLIAKLGAALKPGGRLLFRDYGRYDAAQLRFGKGQKVGAHRYVKGDATACYYFDLDDVAALFAGFDVLSLKLDCRQEANRATRTRRRRVFVQGDFRKRG